MKVLHCITSLDRDGAQQMLLRLVQSLDPKQFQHVVVSLRERMPFADEFEANGVRVYCLGMSPARPSVRGFRALRKILADESPDLIQGWLYHANCAVILAKVGLSLRAPVVWGIRGSLDQGWLRGFSTSLVIRLSAFLSRFVEVVTFNSRLSITHHRDAGYVCKDMRYVPNGFQIDRFSPERTDRAAVSAQFNIPREAPLIGIAGRYNQAKDYPGFLRAFSLVLAECPSAHALLIGRSVDDQNPELMSLVQELGIINNVHLVGPQADLGAIFPGLDIFCSSSITEGFPNVVAEALACGIPGVVTDVGMSAELVEGAGVVVPPGDFQALADGIISLINLPREERRMLGERGRQRICGEYDLNSVVTQYHDLYQGMVRT